MVAYPRLREVVEEYSATATAELEFAGFATEADYLGDADAYSLPAFMLVASAEAGARRRGLPRGAGCSSTAASAGLHQRPRRGPGGREAGHPDGTGRALLGYGEGPRGGAPIASVGTGGAPDRSGAIAKELPALTREPQRRVVGGSCRDPAAHCGRARAWRPAAARIRITADGGLATSDAGARRKARRSAEPSCVLGTSDGTPPTSGSVLLELWNACRPWPCCAAPRRPRLISRTSSPTAMPTISSGPWPTVYGCT
ncbi:hypothetical protein SPURM210S_03912 [Streptomyces purpurascens]